MLLNQGRTLPDRGRVKRRFHEGAAHAGATQGMYAEETGLVRRLPIGRTLRALLEDHQHEGSERLLPIERSQRPWRPGTREPWSGTDGQTRSDRQASRFEERATWKVLSVYLYLTGWRLDRPAIGEAATIPQERRVYGGPSGCAMSESC